MRNVIGDMIEREGKRRLAALAELRQAIGAERGQAASGAAARNTGRKGCPWPQNDPGRSCPPHTYCARVGVCRREAAAYRQGAVAWEADIALAANPYAGVADLGYAWGRGWRDRAEYQGPTA